MRVLVVYASKYGSTKGIAERIAQKLNELGIQAAALPVRSAGRLEGYDAFVIGSAAYMFNWMKEATAFVQRNTALLATKPVWLFSSGPIGPDKKDAQGRDVLETTVPKQIAQLTEEIHPRGHRVFFGAFHADKLTVGHRMVYALPALKKVMIEGDYRDWIDIDAWAATIAAALQPAGVR